MEGRGVATPQVTTSLPTPSLARRMTCFVYEALLLFGIALIPAIIGTLVFARLGQGHLMQGESALRIFALVVYGIYFVGFWSVRGQTLAMQTWHIRVVDATGQRPTKARASARYAAGCIAWFMPATLIASWVHLPPWPTLGAVAVGIVGYALLALAAPDGQFWHDIVCGTRLVDARGEQAPPSRQA
ncbi:MAG: RDD family protein [Caldimonas sp.]